MNTTVGQAMNKRMALVWGVFWRMMVSGIVGGAVLGGLYGAIVLPVFLSLRQLSTREEITTGAAFGAYLGGIAGLSLGLITGVLTGVATYVYHGRTSLQKYRPTVQRVNVGVTITIAVLWVITSEFGFYTVPALLAMLFAWWMSGVVARWYMRKAAE